MTFFGKFLIGVDREKLFLSAKSESIYQYHDWRPTLCEARAQGKIAPSSIVKFLFGKTSSGSTSRVCPSPVHLSHAPYGELKEKRRGSIGGREISQTGQAKCSEKGWSPSFSTETTAIPSPFLNAVSSESTRRDLSVSLSSINLSTTTSKECFFLGSSFSPKASPKLITTPSSRTPKNPSLAKIRSSLLCSPFLSRTSGPKIKIGDPVGSWKIFFTIWSMDCFATFLPHFGQCGSPKRANKILR